ncbi:MAG: Xaa-Pro peptidase family protein [Pseudomonadota bacterium]
MHSQRISTLTEHMCRLGIDVTLITDEDNVYYLCGYYDYLHMEFGRPTILLVFRDGETHLITPEIDHNTAKDAARVDHIYPWNDGVGDEWRTRLPDLLKRASVVGVETEQMPSIVKSYMQNLNADRGFIDIMPSLAGMRMIKSGEELQLARHAGQVATAMMEAGREAIASGVPEYEVAIATSNAGTRTAAAILAEHHADSSMSPNTHFLQIMASGDQITRTHHRATNRIMKTGEPVFLCFCGMTNFHRFKLGFDRTFWIGEPADKQQLEIYQVAVDSQAAALRALKPGVSAESVHAAYAEVIQSAGYDFPFRCGRGTGFSFLEKPQLVFGDNTTIQPGMVLAVDGSVNTDTFRAQVGDSFIITEDGFEALTFHGKSLEDVTLH